MEKFVLTKLDVILGSLIIEGDAAFYMILTILVQIIFLPSYKIWAIYILLLVALISIFFDLKKFRRIYINNENYEALVIDESGIVCADDEYKYTVMWEDIEKVILLKRSYKMKLSILAKDDDVITFDLSPYEATLRIYALRNSIMFFSDRPDIIEVRFRMWLNLGIIPVLPLKWYHFKC